MRSYEIKLTSPGFDSAVTNLTKMGTALNRIEQRLSKLTQSGAGIDGLTKRIEKLADQVERLGVAAGGVRGGGGGGGVRSSSSGGGSRFIAGPNQRLQTIASQMPQAILQNNVAAVADLERAKRLSERSIALDTRRKNDPEHLTRPGLLELFSQMNSLLGKLGRGDIGGSIIQLNKLSGGRNTGGGVNIQQMQAYGLSSVMGGSSAGAGAAAGGSGAMASGLAMAGRLAGPVGVLIGTGLAIKKLAEVGAAAFKMNADAAAALGSSLSGAMGTTALGINPGLGAGLRSRLSSDPWAQSVGGYALPSHLTGQSDADLLDNQVRRLRLVRQEKGEIEATRQMRILGLESERSSIMMSKDAWAMREKDAALSKKLGQGQDGPMADYKASQERMKVGVDMIGQRMLQNWALFATPVNNLFANIATYLGGTTWAGPGAGNANANTPMSKNTAAIEELNRLLTQMIGGGPRARGALSPAQRAAVARGMDWDTARNLGAFRL